MEQFTKSFAQIVQATFHPVNVGTPLLEGFYGSAFPLTIFMGVIWAKYAVFHLFPIPPLPGGAWWSEALRRPGNDKPLEWIQTICALVILSCWIPWAVAWWHFVMRH